MTKLSLHPDDRRKAIAWAFGTAKKLGYTIVETQKPDEDCRIWVTTSPGSSIGCTDVDDFVRFISDEIKRPK